MPIESPAKEGGRSRPLSSGFKLETYWKLLEEEFKPKGNKLLSIIELWTQSNQGSKTLNDWLTYIHNLVEAFVIIQSDSTDRIIRDVLIIGCEFQQCQEIRSFDRSETITLNEVIEILQTEASTNSTLMTVSGDPEQVPSTIGQLCLIRQQEQEIQETF